MKWKLRECWSWRGYGEGLWWCLCLLTQWSGQEASQALVFEVVIISEAKLWGICEDKRKSIGHSGEKQMCKHWEETTEFPLVEMVFSVLIRPLLTVSFCALASVPWPQCSQPQSLPLAFRLTVSRLQAWEESQKSQGLVKEVTVFRSLTCIYLPTRIISILL